MTDIQFADISEFQANANILTYSAWSDTLIARAHNGYRPDHSFPGRLGIMRASTLRTRIYYQYIVAGADPAWQARAFIATIGTLQPGEGVMADYEEGPTNAIARLRAWFAVVDPWAKLSHGAALYTGESFLNSYLGGAGTWAGRPLVLAKYSQPEPTEPHIAWQFTDGVYNGRVNVPGIGYCDLSVHHGSSGDLSTGLGIQSGSTPAPAPVPSPVPITQVVAGMAAPDGQGYWMVSANGQVKGYGSAKTCGDLTTVGVNSHIVDAWATPTGGGYTLVGADGGIFCFGDAGFFGSLGGQPLAKPIVAGFPTVDHKGYWLVGGDGGVFCFGNAPFDGSEGGKTLAASVVNGAGSHDGNGYWLVAADGGVFTFGDAPFDGSAGGIKLSAPVVCLAPTPSGDGYWMAAADGGVFAEGAAPFKGSAGSVHLAKPIVDIATTPSGQGYWLFAADAGVFAFGDAQFFGAG
jgi:hypothetical protein